VPDAPSFLGEPRSIFWSRTGSSCTGCVQLTPKQSDVICCVCLLSTFFLFFFLFLCFCFFLRPRPASLLASAHSAPPRPSGLGSMCGTLWRHRLITTAMNHNGLTIR
jgi:hypothetical protein